MSRRRPEEVVGLALAYAFLECDTWTAAELVAAGRGAIERQPGWLRPLAAQVLDRYPRPPAGRPNELGTFLAGLMVLSEPMRRAAVRGRPIRVRHWPATPGTAGPMRWDLPPAPDLSVLSRLLEVPAEQLDWLADPQGRQRRGAADWMHVYRYRWVMREGAVPRLLEAPTPILRQTLRRLLHRVLDRVPVHPSAHGFVPGRSALTNAARHVGSPVVVGLDLRHFFAQVTAGRVLGLWQLMGYPEPVAQLLAALTTHRVPASVLGQMPAGGESSVRHRLRARLRGAHLPQGAPTSPTLANLACYSLDRRLDGYARAVGGTYTRYADDLTLSGPADLAPRAGALARAVAALAEEEGFELHPGKTRVLTPRVRHVVTGVVVNDRTGVPREAYDRLRAVLHDAVQHGPEAANRGGHPDFRASLLGQIGWVESVNPVRGRRLRVQFDSISWPPGAVQPPRPADTGLSSPA